MKLTPTLTAKIAELVEIGNSAEVAAVSLGVPRSTYFRWMAKGREQETGPYANLVAAIATAHAQAEVDIVAAIRDPVLDRNGKADPSVSNGLKWLLERTRRERYGPKVEIEMHVRQQATDDLIARLRQGLDAEAYESAVAAVLGEGSPEERD